MLYDYLLKNYKRNEPIFVSDIDLPVTNTNLRQMFKSLCDKDKIRRFDKGAYYLPTKSRLKNASLIAPDVVIQYKYVSRRGKVYGYYSGFTFANQMGMTTQVPYILEIVSNAASANVRQVNVKGRKIILRKPKAVVTAQNYRILQFLDLLKDIEIYTDDANKNAAIRLTKYIKNENMKQADVDRYLPFYPDKVYRNLYEMRLYNAFA